VFESVDLLCSVACKFGSKSVEKKTNEYQTTDDVYVHAQKDVDTLKVDRSASEAGLGTAPLISDRDRTIGCALILTQRPAFAKPTDQSALAEVADALYVSYSPVERGGKKGLLTQVTTKGGSSAMRPKQRSAARNTAACKGCRRASSSTLQSNLCVGHCTVSVSS
jgi:hypothetical protein